MSQVSTPGIGVVLEAFLDRSLEEVLEFLNSTAPEVTHIEVGAGGYAPHPHCNVDALLADRSARQDWLDLIRRHGLSLDALNAWGNPLHGDVETARRHDADLRNAIRLASELGIYRVVAMAGCPGASVGDSTPHFAAGGWLPFLEGVYERQWEEQIAPYWAGLGAFAQSLNPEILVCLELHPGTSVFNVETFERIITLSPSIAANLDPSHFFWMGMDGHRVAERIKSRVGHAHAKDTIFHTDSLALNGMLDRRWPAPAEDMPWTFGIPGRGHDLEWWTELVRRLEGSPVQVFSIEHEDPFVTPEVGVPEAARLLREAIDAVHTPVGA